MTKSEKEEIIRVEEFIAAELERISTPLELMATQDNEKLERANVLYKLYKILENYDDINPTLTKFFNERARKERMGGVERWD